MDKIKIHLIKTHDFSNRDYFALSRLLDKVKGPLKFSTVNTEFKGWKFDPLKNPFLNWNQIFKSCEAYRTFFKLPTDDFVVLCTPKKNTKNYFSCFDEINNNIFVHTSEWDTFTKSAAIYPIAYEIISNILQKMMKLPLTTPNQWIHKDPIGCINDMCKKKNQIILKLRTADICENCLKKMKKEGVSEDVIDQSLALLEIVRKESLFSQGFSKNRTLERVVVNDEGEIFIGNAEIILNSIQKTLYIFYLCHPEGLENKDIYKHKEELFKIYEFYSSNQEPIDNLIRLPKNGKSTINNYQSKINKELKSKLNRLAEFYLINGKRYQKYSVDIPKRYISISVNIKTS